MVNPHPCAHWDGQACDSQDECERKGICRFKYREARAVPEPVPYGPVQPPERPEYFGRVENTLKARQSIYGSPKLNFDRIATLAYELLGPTSEVKLFTRRPTAVEVGYIQLCIKLGRAMQSPRHKDTVHDIAGYAECIKQILIEEDSRD